MNVFVKDLLPVRLPKIAFIEVAGAVGHARREIGNEDVSDELLVG